MKSDSPRMIVPRALYVTFGTRLAAIGSRHAKVKEASQNRLRELIRYREKSNQYSRDHRNPSVPPATARVLPQTTIEFDILTTHGKSSRGDGMSPTFAPDV